MSSPVQVYSPLLGLDLRAAQAAQATLELDPAFEHAVVCLSDSAEIAGEPIVPGELFYLAPGRAALSIGSAGPCHLLLIGGVPFEENVMLWWNFVGRSSEELRQATEDWNAGRHFGTVETSLARIPAPTLGALHLRGSRQS